MKGDELFIDVPILILKSIVGLMVGPSDVWMVLQIDGCRRMNT